MAGTHDPEQAQAGGGREAVAQKTSVAGVCEVAAYSREAAAILASRHPIPPMDEIGRSREGRPIRACRIGDGPLRVSLVGGCHADEPVGPRFLERLARYLSSPAGAELRKTATWHLVPHLNPDGAVRNAAWQPPGTARYDFAAYLRHRVRELPGDDVEFGFPAQASGGDGLETDLFDASPDAGSPSGRRARGKPTRKVRRRSTPRPENVAAAAFWGQTGPFDLHASLHGMSFAAGPYFLLERSWWPRFNEAGTENDAGLAGFLAEEVDRAGYVLHDVERNGEKGFHRLARGFCSRPDSSAMKRHFLDRGEPEVAARFRPSSMEAIRALGGDPLTLVSEMPLFVLPGVGETLGPPDPAMERWRARIAEWDARLQEAVADVVRPVTTADSSAGGRPQASLAGVHHACGLSKRARDKVLDGPQASLLGVHHACSGSTRRGEEQNDEGRQGAETERQVRREAAEAGLAPMPVADQMRFQWAFVRAGLAAAGRHRSGSRAARPTTGVEPRPNSKRTLH